MNPPNQPNKSGNYSGNVSYNPSGVLAVGSAAVIAGIVGSKLTFGKVTPFGMIIGTAEGAALAAGAVVFYIAWVEGAWSKGH